MRDESILTPVRTILAMGADENKSNNSARSAIIASVSAGRGFRNRDFSAWAETRAATVYANDTRAETSHALVPIASEVVVNAASA